MINPLWAANEMELRDQLISKLRSEVESLSFDLHLANERYLEYRTECTALRQQVTELLNERNQWR